MSASSRHSRTSFVVGDDLVGQGLATGRGLGHLQEEAGREDALVVEPREMDGLDAGQFVDRWHGSGEASTFRRAMAPLSGLRAPVADRAADTEGRTTHRIARPLNAIRLAVSRS